MLKLTKITQTLARTITKDGLNVSHIKFERKEDVKTTFEDIKFKDLGEIVYNSYEKVVNYLTDELSTIAEEVELDAYTLSGNNINDTYELTLYDGTKIDMSSYTLGYRVRVTKLIDGVEEGTPINI